MLFSTVNTFSVPENKSLKNLGQIIMFSLLSLLHLQKNQAILTPQKPHTPHIAFSVQILFTEVL